MSRKENFLRVLCHEETTGEVPLWELHFHLWDKLGEEHFISGREYLGLSEREKKYALEKDAEIIAEWGERLQFSAVSMPDPPWDCIYTLPSKDRLELIRNIRKRNPDFGIVASCGAVIAMPSSGDGYEDFCYKLFDEPEEIDQMCEKIFANFLENSRRLIDAGADAIYTASDVADNRTPFFTREQQLRWYFPYLKKFAEYLRSQRIGAILHTDGNIKDLLADIKASGVDGLQAIDPVAGMDIREVQIFMENRVAVCGNLDCGLMLTGKPEQVYEEARSILETCKDRPGFIFGNSNAVAIETPVENYMAMLEAWKKYGKLGVS